MARSPDNRAYQVPVVGERRQLTILFCDLVEYTPLAEKLDAEELASVVIEYQEVGRRIFERYGGYVAQFLGDGLLVYFGYPEAHEDDPERAVRAALDLLDEIDLLNKSLGPGKGVRLAARIGIYTGPSVVGRSATSERSVVFGETVNIASRIEAAAPAGAIFMGEATMRLLRNRVLIRDEGLRQLKGVAKPIRLYRVVGLPPAGGALRTWNEPKAYVGRTRERSELWNEWGRAQQGARCAISISGEPGIGKSRLVRYLRNALSRTPHRWLETHCAPLAKDTSLYPVATLITRALAISEDEPDAEKLVKLTDALESAGLHSEESVSLLAPLVGIRSVEAEPSSASGPEIRRRRTLELLTTWIGKLAQPEPLVLVCEDLHWSDSTTLELLGLLLESDSVRRLLCIVTFRPEFETRWKFAAPAIVLKGLAHDEAVELARAASKATLTEPTLDRIVERADGNPLFIEEQVKMLSEAGASAHDADVVPHTLDALLMARLDRLGPAVKHIAQLAAALGREFSYSLLVSLASAEPPVIEDAVNCLLKADIVQPGSDSNGYSYIFRHALIQDAAYQSLLRSERHQIHERVVELLKSRFPQRVENEPELVAHHLLRAGVPMEAAEWFRRAGRHASERAAVEEATSHYRHGLSALEGVGAREGSAREQLEMSLQILLGNALMGVRGFSSPETLPVWQRAIALAEKLGDIDELTSAMNGLATYHFGVGNCQAAVDYGKRILEIANPQNKRIAKLRAHCTIALGLVQIGDGADALWHAEKAIEAYQPTDFRLVTYGVGTDIRQGVVAFGTAATASWWLGRPDVALGQVRKGLELAEQLDSALSLAAGRTYLALIHHMRREITDAAAVAGRNVEFCERLHFPFWRGLSLLISGAQQVSGASQGLADILLALETLSGAGSQTGATLAMSILAQAQRATGDTESALETVDKALMLSAALGQRFWDAELLRLKGEILASRGALPAAAEACRAALDEARARGARSLELRAALALTRVLATSTRHEEARTIVAGIYQRFTEGFDTADLRDAAALMN